MELNDVEKLAVAQAFVNTVGDMTKTKSQGNLRGRVDDMMKERYYDDPLGGKSFDVRVQGVKVGTYSLTVSKPTESQTKLELMVEDKDALAKWAEENGFMMVDFAAVEGHFADTGCVPDGCKPIELVVPGDSGGIVTRTTLKVDAGSVAEALGPMLEPATRALLEGGFDE